MGKFMMNGIEYVGSGGGSGGGNVDDVYVNGTSVLDSDKIAQITSYKEVTYAEWEALPDTKYTDGIAYFIKDSTEAEGFPPLIYSREERQIGTWIDGKPLYQKTYKKTISGAGSSVLLDNNVDYVHLVNSAYYTSEGSDVVSPFYDGTTVACFVVTNASTHELSLVSRYNGTLIWVVTIQYTKATDTAGSGIWAGNGAMAHHYLTNEVIVGTWIDGKPIYEKTFDIGAISAGDTKNIDISSLNIDYVTEIKGCGYSSQYNQSLPLPFVHSQSVYVISVNTTSSNANLAVATGSGVSLSKSSITIQYTKSTN